LDGAYFWSEKIMEFDKKITHIFYLHNISNNENYYKKLKSSGIEPFKFIKNHEL
jgi:hypothetical protein